jgi:hypothetical protein
VTVPVALEGGQQLVHFGLGQMLPDPVGIAQSVLVPAGKVDMVFPRRPLDLLVALRYFLACRSWTILLDISAPPLPTDRITTFGEPL